MRRVEDDASMMRFTAPAVIRLHIQKSERQLFYMRKRSLISHSSPLALRSMRSACRPER